VNIVMAGGTGFLGRSLCRALCQQGHRLTILTRRAAGLERVFGPAVKLVEWDATHEGPWEQALQGAEAVINLAGAHIAEARWTEARKRLITESRLQATRILVQACSRSAVQPRLFLNASGIGYYGPQGDQLLNESDRPGQGFLADLCVQWEAAAGEAAFHGMRVIVLRTGMVLEGNGGALPRLALPFRLFLGGPVMPGTQWISWIHRDDWVGLIEWALANTTISGPINMVAPHPVKMVELCRTLATVLRRSSWFPVPELVLRLALGELASLMTTGQRVAPTVAQQGGYRFRHPFLEGALRAILTKPRGSMALAP
jgi:uncharacterized protein